MECPGYLGSGPNPKRRRAIELCDSSARVRPKLVWVCCGSESRNLWSGLHQRCIHCPEPKSEVDKLEEMVPNEVPEPIEMCPTQVGQIASPQWAADTVALEDAPPDDIPVRQGAD